MSDPSVTSAPPAPASPSAGASLKRLAIRASIWNMGSYGTGQVLRLAGNLVMTRILFPDVFGLYSLVFTFWWGLAMFSDVGIGPAVVQSRHGEDPRFLDTAWTVQCIRGGMLFLAACAIGFPVAIIYQQPLLRLLLPAQGLVAILDGFGSTKMHEASRHLRAKWSALVELTTQITNIATIILLALALRAVLGPHDLRSVWAVVGGGVVSESVRLVLSHTVLPGHRNRFLMDRDARRALMGFGTWVFVSTMLMYLATQADRLLFGRLVPLAVLGVYGIALALAELPATAANRLVASVLFPSMSRIVDRDDFGDVFRRSRAPLAIGGAMVVSGLVSAGPYFVHVLYDARYADAGWMLQMLAASAWFRILESSNAAALLAHGRVKWIAADNAVKLVCLVALLPLGMKLGGFRGALVGIVLSDVARYGMSLVGARRIRLYTIGSDTLYLLAVAASAAVASLAGWAAARAGGTWAGLGAAALVAGGIWSVQAGRYWMQERARRDGAAPAPPALA